MSDETTEINIDLAIDSPYLIETIRKTVNDSLNGHWDPSTGMVTKTTKLEVYVDEVDEDGVFNDPLTEETYLEQLREDLLSHVQESLMSAIESILD
ncbi:MAG: hypothetical protein JAZ17_11655 [Candidatus Thiodiazotropha endolucinida]|nr:hypothetical protein [Candidatus Thiodiazotropha endolucinida]MCG8094259.1 hypothetical protein [Candidatus Thiodiazotropha endolucinida]MCW4228160.1 hypothetical protein [Candidatus Thiodiazotropha taylori]